MNKENEIQQVMTHTTMVVVNTTRNGGYNVALVDMVTSLQLIADHHVKLMNITREFYNKVGETVAHLLNLLGVGEEEAV